MRFMPTSSVFDRDIARAKARSITTTDHSKRQIYLMRGIDRSARNSFANA